MCLVRLEMIQVASPSKNFFKLALPAARELDRGERKSACVGALFWIIRACAIVVGLCRGVKTFLVAKRLRWRMKFVEKVCTRERPISLDNSFANVSYADHMLKKLSGLGGWPSFPGRFSLYKRDLSCATFVEYFMAINFTAENQ